MKLIVVCCDFEFIRELVIIKCLFLGDKYGVIVFRLFYKCEIKENILF